MKAIAKARVKTDNIDSETLAHLLRANLLPESYVPPRDIRELRDRVRRRAFLVEMRTKLKNRVHSELAKRGIKLGVPLFTREGITLLMGLGLEAVDQILPVMETLDRQSPRRVAQDQAEEAEAPRQGGPHHKGNQRP